MNRLAGVEPQHYLDLRFRLQASTRLLESSFPILAIWQANLADEPGEKRIDLTAGADRLLLVRAFRGVRIHRLNRGELAFLTRLLAREAFGPAVASASAADPSFDASASLQKFVALHIIVDFYL